MRLMTPREYLKVHVANSFGLDKKLWQERIDWFDAQEQFDLEQAEEPAMAFAALQAWEDTKNGFPTGHPIALDATASGIQLMACMTGDRKAAAYTNAIDTGIRNDVYTSMNSLLGTYERDKTKKAIMTNFYGSERIPLETFGDDLPRFEALMESELEGPTKLNRFLMDCWDANATIHEWVMPDNFHVTIPVKVTVKEEFTFLGKTYAAAFKREGSKAKGRSLSPNVVHSVDGYIVREITRMCDYNRDTVLRAINALQIGKGANHLTSDGKMVRILWDHYLRTGHLSARILDYITKNTVGLISDREVVWEMIQAMPEQPFKVLSVHDSFRVHCNYGNDLRKQYNRQLMLLAKGNLLDSILSQLLGQPITVSKLDPDLWKDVANADYALS